MTLFLDSESVLAYVKAAGLWREDCACEGVEPKPGKNFNLRVRGGDRDLLVKQSSRTQSGELSDELMQESYFYQMVAKSLSHSLEPRLLPPLHCDLDRKILVFPYLSNVCDLSDLYDLSPQSILQPQIAAAVGETFAALHSSTFQQKKLQDYWLDTLSPASRRAAEPVPDFLVGLRRLTPEHLCVIASDALKFYRFYQRYPEMGQSIEALNRSFDACCIVHDDPRFANILVDDSTSKVTLIDWEKWRWGDPGYDLGRLIANYLMIWLESLPVSAEVKLADTLENAAVPLSAINANTEALVRAYLTSFPEILSGQPDFIVRLIRYTGLGLIHQLQTWIFQRRPIRNAEMAMVQVAKSLLCRPEASIETVFGCSRETIEDVATAPRTSLAEVVS